METPEHNDLEKFIHAQLQKLPEREAPATLSRNVLEAIARRKKLPWWKQSFLHWPQGLQCVLFAVLLTLFGGAAYGAAQALNHVAKSEFTEQLSSYGWVWRTARSIGETLVLALSSLPLQWLIGAGLLLLALYAACIALGFALFRVTARAGSAAV